MDRQLAATLTRRLSELPTRHGAIRGLLGIGAAIGAPRASDVAVGKKGKARQRRKRRKRKTEQEQCGAYRPMNAEGSAIAFNAPAPNAGANAALAVCDGGNPNGTWRLFIQDGDAPSNPGFSSTGWGIEITTRSTIKKRK